MTNEDVLPQWLRNFLLEGVLGKECSARLPRVKIKICLECNATSNRHIEEPARPTFLKMALALVSGPVALSPVEAQAMAAWMIKTDLMFAMLRLLDRSRETWVHPVHADDWDPDERVRSHGLRLKNLIYDGQVPANSFAGAALIGRVRWWRRRRVARRTDGNYTSHGVSVWLPLVLETLVEDQAREAHVRMRRFDERFVVLWPPPSSEIVFPAKPLGRRDMERFARGDGYGNRIAVVEP